MEINEHFSKIIEGILEDIKANVGGQVASTINEAVIQKLNSYDFTPILQHTSREIFEAKVSQYTIDSKKLETRITERINAIIDEVTAQTDTLVRDLILKKFGATDFENILKISLTNLLADKINEFAFPANSINANSLNFDNYFISGNNIRGGIIQDFGSTGIDDKSTQVALTILDEATVVENNLLTKDLTVEGTMTVNGEFVVNGRVPQDSEFFKSLTKTTAEASLASLDNTIFNRYKDNFYNEIKEKGLDLSRITVNGNEVISNNKLGQYVTESNLRKLGQLEELQVQGETLLSETFYTTKKRVGINTIEPSSTLSIWDDEVEVIVQKKQKDTALIAVPRNQKLVIGSNNKDNIVLEPDGSARMAEIKLGNVKFTAADVPPNYVSERGHIVFNSNPNLGGPIGWICLGSANWANFGIID